MGLPPKTCLVLVICFRLLAMGHSSHAQNSPQDYLAAHNSARAQLGVAPLRWDNNLAAYAQNYARKRIGDCAPISCGGPYGENIFWWTGRNFSAADAVGSWVAEKQYYDYNSNTCEAGKVCLQYTQVVWRNAARVGCAREIAKVGHSLSFAAMIPQTTTMACALTDRPILLVKWIDL